MRLGAVAGLQTLRTLFVVMVPVMLGMMALEATGILPRVASVFSPLMRLLGLPGNAALAFLSGALLNLYSAVAVAQSIALTVKQITVLGLLGLICHNLLVECGVQRQAGTGIRVMLAVRLLTGIAAAYLASLLIPDGGVWGDTATLSKVTQEMPVLDLIRTRAIANLIFLAKVAAIVLALMIAVEFLRQTGALRILTRLMRPVTWLAGLPPQAGFTVVTSMTLGLAYGAGTVIAEAKRGELTDEEGYRTNVFIGTTHSLIEDTALFAVLHASVGVIVLGRLVVGCAAVRGASLVRRLVLRGRAAVKAPEKP